jgi:Flp pilus assembly protein protease CpaA
MKVLICVIIAVALGGLQGAGWGAMANAGLISDTTATVLNFLVSAVLGGVGVLIGLMWREAAK